MSETEYPFSNEELKKIVSTHLRKQNYRRVYYKNKYKTDDKFKNYMIDYNKIRYEEKRFVSKYTPDNYDSLSDEKALRLKKWFDKKERPDDFKNKCPEDYLIYKDYMENITPP
jgi:hypothetical protein